MSEEFDADAEVAIRTDGRIAALEIMMVALAQRVPGGDKAIGAALIMLDAVCADLLDHPDPEVAAWHANVMRIARQSIEKVGREVIAFRDGDGVHQVG